MTMNKQFRSLALSLACVLLAGVPLVGCGASAPGETTTAPDNTTPADTSAGVPTTADNYIPDLEVRTFGGEEFCTATFENVNFHYSIITESETGEVLNDSIFRRNQKIEETYDVTLTQHLYADFSADIKNVVLAGDDSYDLIVLRCVEALNWYKEGLLTSAEDLPNINLEKGYWSQSINESLSIAGHQYIAQGAFNLDNYDLTFCLIFNKELADKHQLDDLYQLVRDGDWTMDKMEEYMTVVTDDLNGDTVMDDRDVWGYLAHPKMAAPGFWIGADVTSISKDEDDIPYISMKEQRFVDVFDRIFGLTWDSGAAYMTSGDNSDIPTEIRNMFSGNQSLFMDMSFFYFEQMRSMDTDFGILPYPKYDDKQESYRSRVCYYMPTIVPVSCKDPDFTGYMLEVLNCESYKTVVPAYYEMAIKGKATRDEESIEMLDLIVSTRVIDIGDSTLCSTIRDNFIRDMMLGNNRDLISNVTAKENEINEKLSFMIE